MNFSQPFLLIVLSVSLNSSTFCMHQHEGNDNKPRREDNQNNQLLKIKRANDYQQSKDFREALITEIKKKNCDLKRVAYLLTFAWYADVNGKDNDGKTPAHYALEKRNLECLHLLIKNDAFVNIKNSFGSTPLHYAAGAGNQKVLQLMIAHGADVNATNNNNETPLHWAWTPMNEKYPCVQILLNNGADVNLKDTSNRTPLYEAAGIEYRPSYLPLLLDKGAQVNTLDYLDQTALHFAARNGHDNYENIQFLIIHGADINAICQDGRTVLHWAAYHGNPECLRVLLEFMDLINKTSREQVTYFIRNKTFQQQCWTFLLCLKRKQSEKVLTVPRFIKFEILSFVCTQYWIHATKDLINATDDKHKSAWDIVNCAKEEEKEEAEETRKQIRKLIENFIKENKPN